MGWVFSIPAAAGRMGLSRPPSALVPIPAHRKPEGKMKNEHKLGKHVRSEL
jgi:hypothetical protein